MAAFTDADLAAVRKAIASGVLTVEFSDRRTTYRSIDELLKAEEHIARAISTTPRAKQSFGIAGKGL